MSEPVGLLVVKGLIFILSVQWGSWVTTVVRTATVPKTWSLWFLWLPWKATMPTSPFHQWPNQWLSTSMWAPKSNRFTCYTSKVCPRVDHTTPRNVKASNCPSTTSTSTAPTMKANGKTDSLMAQEESSTTTAPSTKAASKTAPLIANKPYTSKTSLPSTRAPSKTTRPTDMANSRLPSYSTKAIGSTTSLKAKLDKSIPRPPSIRAIS